MTTLDKPQQIKSLDKSGMAEHILDLPKQIQETWQKARQIDFPNDWDDVQNICLCGMGGSAVANNLVSNLPQLDRKIPMYVARGYEIPGWVQENSLVILTSHSGATKETISAFKYAADAEAKIFIVAERGQIEKLGTKEKAIVFDYNTKAPPRASLGYQLGAVFGALEKLHILNYDLTNAIKLLEKMNNKLKPEIKTKENFAKHLAFSAFDHLPVMIGSGILKSVVWRWKTQINENANQFAFTEFLPEAMHNAIQGLDLPTRFQDDLIYFILQNTFDKPELINQFDKLKSVLQEKNIRYEIIEAEGEDVFSQKLSTLIIGDWVSYYLAILNNVDPTPVETITALKY
ncbi:hypothetical protein KKC16_00400 [Patescibacteria group bacterium]|nr:hypothetical protein [Patescibacteria group bacterium]MBU4481902.1 hypothetical protein [Patescibacteria group bacterium]